MTVPALIARGPSFVRQRFKAGLVGPMGASDADAVGVSVERFGVNAVPGVTDCTAMFQAAVDTGKPVAALNGPYLIDGTVLNRPGVHIRGPLHSPGEILPYSSADYMSRRGTLIVNPAAKIVQDHKSGISGFTVVRKGLGGPWSTAGEAATGIAAFAGSPIWWDQKQDVRVSDILALGFSYAAYGTGERSKVERVQFDCTNGVVIQAATDVVRVTDCHGFPFLTAHAPWVTNTLLQRAGSAFLFGNTADWCKMTNCFSFAYATGFEVVNADNCVLLGCMADGAVQVAGTRGFYVHGTSKETVILGGQTGQQAYGLVFDYSGNPFDERAVCTATTFRSWGATAAHLYAASGRLIHTGGYHRAGGVTPVAGVAVDPTNGSVFSTGNVFDGTSDPYTISGAAIARSVIGPNWYPNCPNFTYDYSASRTTAVFAPTSGQTITIPSLARNVVLNIGTPLAALAIAMPAVAADGQEITISAMNTITAVTHTAPAGVTLRPAIGTFNPYSSYVYKYVAASATWFLVGGRP